MAGRFEVGPALRRPKATAPLRARDGGLNPRQSSPCAEKSKIYERSQEVVENKGPHFSKAKRSMKTNELNAESQEVIDGQGFTVF
jgi:hypothetical protein